MTRDTIPGPRGKWLVGDVVAYQRDRIAWLVGNRDTYGDIVRLAPGTAVVHDAELAHEILAATDDSYTIDSMLRAGRRQRELNEAHLRQWMRVRRGVWRTVAERVTRLHAERIATDLKADLRRHAGRQVDVLAVCRAMLGRAIADFCVGGERNATDLAELCAAADDLFVSALDSLVNGEGRVGWWPRPAASAAVRANTRLLELLEGLVRRRRATGVPDQPRDLMDGLVAGIDTEADVQHAVLVLRTILFASHGVPGTAFSWVALRLAEHPDSVAAVAAEARKVLHTNTTELATVAPYTSAFLKEVLRLHPPQWLITRTSRTPVRLGGHAVRPNSEILVCPYLIHRDPRWWPDPERFDPHRWLGRDRPHARHAYLPFGAGPRVCPGTLLATVQLTILTALLARDYHLDLPALADVKVDTDGLMRPATLTGRWHPAVPT